MDARENLHQRRFAGAVVADQRHHFAGMDIQLHVAQGRHRTEILRDATQAQNQFAFFNRRFGNIGHLGPTFRSV